MGKEALQPDSPVPAHSGIRRARRDPLARGLAVGLALVVALAPLSLRAQPAPPSPEGSGEERPAGSKEPPGETEVPPAATPTSDERLLLQEIPSVYSASKYEQKVTQAPSSVSIVTAEEIKRFGYRTLAEILRSVRGFYISYDRNYTYLGVRGFSRPGDYNSRILVLVDGHRINDSVYDGALIGTEFPLDVDLIDRVEIVRGPSSSLYGNNAFFAVVNVITRRGRELQLLEASTEAGTLTSYKGRLTFGRRFQNGFEGILSGTYFSTEGKRRLHFPEFDDPATNNGIAERRDADRFSSLFTTLSYRDLTLQAAHSSRSKDIPTGSFDTVFNDPHTSTTDDFSYADLKYEHVFDVNWQALARVYYDDYYYIGTYPYALVGGVVLNKDRTWGRRWGGEGQATIRALDRHVLIAGAQFDDNFQQDQKNYDESPFLQYLDDRRQSFHWGLYAQDEFTLWPELILNAGVRHDEYEDFGGTTNPRLALIYTPLRDTALKLIYGRAFRAPNVYERFYAAPSTQKGNPSLQPEKIATYELIAEQYLWGWLRGTVVGFYYTIDDLITQETDPDDGLLVFRNAGRTRSRGVELELEGKWSSGFLARASYAFQETKDKGTNRILSDSPRHVAQLNLIAPIVRDALFAGLELQYVGDRKSRSGQVVEGKVIANLTLFSVNLPIRRLEVSATVYNLFDTSYRHPVSDAHRQEAIEQDGRSLRFKLTYSF